MKSKLTALDIFYLIQEMQEVVEGKVDKIYQMGKKEFEIRFYVPNKGKKVLIIMLPGLMYFSQYKHHHPENPPNFCTFLRKRLENAWVQEIKQHEFERVVEFTLVKKQTFRLILELFSKGNLILCKEDYEIISPLQNEKWKDREIKPNVKYKFPEKKSDIFDIKAENILENKKAIVKVLASDYGLGGTYAEEVCFLAGIDKMSADLNEKQARSVVASVKELFSKKIQARKYEKIISAFEMKSLKPEKFEEFENLSQAIDETFSKKIIKKTKPINRRKKKKHKLNKIIDIQTKRVKGLKKSIVENSNKADYIYKNYSKINKILTALKKEFNKSPDKLKEKFGSNIKSVNPKTKEVVIELDD
ncbi:MAG: hypothetical protein MAG795_01085 [Candidatus Woesearchaeota archaeon]|nr:hypothetical protein [Candidatus Woesearchaeota archaeon]